MKLLRVDRHFAALLLVAVGAEALNAAGDGVRPNATGSAALLFLPAAREKERPGPCVTKKCRNTACRSEKLQFSRYFSTRNKSRMHFASTNHLHFASTTVFEKSKMKKIGG
jgi:hypothetical protein